MIKRHLIPFVSSRSELPKERGDKDRSRSIKDVRPGAWLALCFRGWF